MGDKRDAPLVGGIEAGGTKFVCAVGTSPDDLVETRFPTRSPDETIAEAVEFFRSQTESSGELAAIGIGTFGPADIDPDSPTFGYIKETPKPGWGGADFVGSIRAGLSTEIPIPFDTDVNAAAVGEQRWGAGIGIDDFVYLTFGTGIGGGIISGGSLVHGRGHPEIGHLRIPHNTTADPFAGCCPYHGDCFEGLAAGPALEKRWGQPAESLAQDHPAWQLEADYIADGLCNLAMTLSPARFILGGGVMSNDFLFPMVRSSFERQLAGYLDHPPLDEFIVPPGLGSRSGIAGALALAHASLGH